MSKIKGRSTYIDVMKGLLILLVVVGHLPFFDYDARTPVLIYSFHMPSFLIIGGILSKINEKTKLSEIISKRFVGTLVPYFTFYFISLVLVPSVSWEMRTKSIITIFKGIGDPLYSLNLPLWFLTFYFCSMVFFEMVQWFAYRIKSLICGRSKSSLLANSIVEIITLIFVSAIVYVAFLYARVYKGPRLIFNIEIAAFCIGFVYLGKLFSKLMPTIIQNIKKSTSASVLLIIVSFLSVIMIAFFWCYYAMQNGRIDLNARDYRDALHLYINAISGFVSFASVSYVISLVPIVSDVLSYLGRMSLYIFAYHVPSTIVTANVIIPMLPLNVAILMNEKSIQSIAFLTLCGVAFSLLLGHIHKSYKFAAQK